MSVARQNLFSRVDAFRGALRTDAILSRAPTEVEHNAAARMLRNGLAVVGFAMLEDFIKTRTGEVLNRIGGAGAPAFGDLPVGVQRAATAGVIAAVAFREGLEDQGQRFIQEHAALVASTGATGFQISPLAFGHSRSNLSTREVEDILTAFQIDSPWSAMGSVASRAGVGNPALKTAFDRAATRRHTAAHQANADVESTELSAFVLDLLALCLSFDLLLSQALTKILERHEGYLKRKEKVAARGVVLRFVAHDGTRYWRDTIEGQARAAMRNADFDVVKTAALRHARANSQAVVIHDERRVPRQWFTPAVD